MMTIIKINNIGCIINLFTAALLTIQNMVFTYFIINGFNIVRFIHPLLITSGLMNFALHIYAILMVVSIYAQYNQLKIIQEDYNSNSFHKLDEIGEIELNDICISSNTSNGDDNKDSITEIIDDNKLDIVNYCDKTPETNNDIHENIFNEKNNTNEMIEIDLDEKDQSKELLVEIKNEGDNIFINDTKEEPSLGSATSNGSSSDLVKCDVIDSYSLLLKMKINKTYKFTFRINIIQIVFLIMLLFISVVHIIIYHSSNKQIIERYDSLTITSMSYLTMAYTYLFSIPFYIAILIFNNVVIAIKK
jgi:hypothetical protein